jgi:hypothetical protein
LPLNSKEKKRKKKWCLKCAVIIYAMNNNSKINETRHGSIHPKAWRAWLKLTRQGSWSQSSFGTGGPGAGAPPKGTVTVSLPGPIPEGCHWVIKA